MPGTRRSTRRRVCSGWASARTSDTQAVPTASTGTSSRVSSTMPADGSRSSVNTDTLQNSIDERRPSASTASTPRTAPATPARPASAAASTASCREPAPSSRRAAARSSRRRWPTRATDATKITIGARAMAAITAKAISSVGPMPGGGIAALMVAQSSIRRVPRPAATCARSAPATTTRSPGSASTARPSVPATVHGTSARQRSPSAPSARSSRATAGETYAVPGCGEAGAPSGSRPLEPGAVRISV